MTVVATPGVQQRVDPQSWRTHRFGLPVDRWRCLAGNAFWVTGAGTGYGQALSIALAAAEATVFITGRRVDRLENTRQQAAGMGVDVARLIPLPTDITSRSSVADAVKTIGERIGALRGLINNAALPQPASEPWPLSSLPDNLWENLLTTNITGQWLVTKAALPLLSSGDGFRVVFVTSEAGWTFTPGFGPYNLSKAALNNMGASWAAECAAHMPGHDVQVNVLVPGEAHTEMNRGASDSPYAVVCMTLLLLSHPAGGPNGHFFHRDGRHLAFGYAAPYRRSLMRPETMAAGTVKFGVGNACSTIRSILRRKFK